MPYKTRKFVCAGCKQMIVHNTIPTRKYCSHECYLKGKRNPGELRNCATCGNEFTARVNQLKVLGWGRYCSTVCHLSVMDRPKSRPDMRGDKHPNWKGGIIKGRPDRNLGIYKRWRKAVFERDDYACQMCGQRGGWKEADHIKGWAEYPELRYVVENGRTLCRPCHLQRTSIQFKGVPRNANV